MKTFVVLAGLWAAVYVATCPALLGGILRPEPHSCGTFGSSSTTPIVTVHGGLVTRGYADDPLDLSGPGTVTGVMPATNGNGGTLTIVGMPESGGTLEEFDGGFRWRSR